MGVLSPFFNSIKDFSDAILYLFMKDFSSQKMICILEAYDVPVEKAWYFSCTG